MRTTGIRGPALLVALLLSGPALAAGELPAGVGDDTRAWLELQASGNAAQAAPRPMPGEVADKVYQRYLDSFENRVPDSFDRESFVSSGGSGS